MPKPTLKQIAIAAGLFAAAAGSYAAWQGTRPRRISVCVVTDYSFRNRHTDWRQLLATRFHAVNQIFRGTGVQWDFRDADQPDPTGKLDNIEERRQKLIRTECAADVILGITGQPGATVDAPPFSHTAMAPDVAAQSETSNTWTMAQALVTLFGAPVDRKGSGTLTTRPPESETIPKAARSLISRLRAYRFAEGTEALNEAWGDKAAGALATAYEGNAANPAGEAHRVIGVSLAADGSYPGAIRHLAETVRLEPSNAEAHSQLATAYTHNFQASEAIAEYRAAVKLSPGEAAAHAALAIALANGGLGEDALDEFREALRLDAKFASAQAGRAYVLTQQPGRIEEALAAYHAALDIDPKLPSAVDGLERATALKTRAASEAADLRKVLQQRPADAQAHFALGLAEARSGDLEAGVRAMRRSVELDSTNGLAHDQLAQMLYREGDWGAALDQAEAASRAGYEPPRDMVDRLKRRAGR